MKQNDLTFRRRQLDRQLGTSDDRSGHAPPTGGWIRSIRESLGMTLEALGQRLGVTRATAHQIERAEVDESITLKRLRLAANALECELVIQIVPRRSLDKLVQERAYDVAKSEFAWLNHTMVLENQAIYDADKEEFIAEIARDLIERRDSRLWTTK